MSINLNMNDTITEPSKIHLLPFFIGHDGAANVSKYFNCYMKSNADNTLDASFRGLPLKGTSLSMPEGFKGFVFTETNQHQAEEDERNFFLKDKFDSIAYWNYDKVPSSNDAVTSAMDWIHIAQAIHSDIEESSES